MQLDTTNIPRSEFGWTSETESVIYLYAMQCGYEEKFSLSKIKPAECLVEYIEKSAALQLHSSSNQLVPSVNVNGHLTPKE